MPRRLMSGLLSSLCLCGAVQAENLSGNQTLSTSVDSFTQALEQGQVDLNFNAQFGWLHQHGLRTGQANTLGSKLTYESAALDGGWGLIEFANTSDFFKARHNSGMGTTPTKTSYTVIPDAQGTAMTRALIGYNGLPGNQFIFGRQYIKLDNQRFVGNDTQRLMPRTFDGLTWMNQSFPDLEFFYGFITEQQTPYQGFSRTIGRESLKAHLLNGSWQAYQVGKITGYVYSIKNKDLANLSSNTAGARLDGQQKISMLSILYAAEYAYQRAAHNNLLRYSASLTSLEAGLQWDPLTVKVGYDTLRGDETRTDRSFQRPLGAKNGAFYGLAGQFDTIPQQGLRSASASVALTLWDTTLQLAGYNFRPQAAHSRRYGHEWDVSLSTAFLEHYETVLQYAKTHQKDALSPMVSGNKINLSLKAHF